MAGAVGGMTAPPAAARVGRAQADRIARRALGGGEILGLPRPVPAGAVITAAGPSAGNAISYTSGRLRWRTAARRTRTPVWLFWRDLAPGERFPHLSRLLLVDAKRGRIVDRRQLVWWPLINGRPPGFATEAAAPLDSRFRVPPGGARASDPASERSLGLKPRTQPALPASLGSSTPLAAGLNLRRDCLVSMVNGSDPQFTTDRLIWQTLSSRLGIPYRTAQTPTALDTAVGEQQAAGCSDVILVLAGHGLPALSHTVGTRITPASSLPLVLLGAPSLRLISGRHGGTVTVVATVPEAVDEEDVLNVMRRHAGAQFKLIVDSCYSGRWQDLRTRDPDPNQVQVIATSASAARPSPGPTPLRVGGRIVMPPSPFAFLLSDGVASWAVGSGSVGLDSGNLAKGIARAFAAITSTDATNAGPTITTSVSAQIVPSPGSGPSPSPTPAPAPPCAAIDAYAGRCTTPAGQIAVRVSIYFGGDGTGSVAISPAGVTANSTSPPPSYGNPSFHDVFFYATPGSDVTLTATPGGGSTFGGWARTSNGAGCPQTGSGSPPTCKITVGNGPNVPPGQGFTITVAPYFNRSP